MPTAVSHKSIVLMLVLFQAAASSVSKPPPRQSRSFLSSMSSLLLSKCKALLHKERADGAAEGGTGPTKYRWPLH